MSGGFSFKYLDTGLASLVKCSLDFGDQRYIEVALVLYLILGSEVLLCAY